MQVEEISFPAEHVRSLTWDGDELVDWVGGGQRFALDGTVTPRHVTYGRLFDAAVASPCGEYSVIYTRLGTKGLLLHQGKILREINRSYYRAEDYEYPVALLRTSHGRTLLAHCPNAYNQIELEDARTGECLTTTAQPRQPIDIFHSRLAASPCGRFLVSAGWVWHPIDVVHGYDVSQALQDATHLDGFGLPLPDDSWADDGSSASFTPAGRLLMALDGIDPFNDEGTEPLKGEIRLFDLPDCRLIHTVPMECPGTVLAVGEHHALSLFEHPKLIDLRSGQVLQTWPHINTGTQVTSIRPKNVPPVPPMAFDVQGQRLAIASATAIQVLKFGV